MQSEQQYAVPVHYCIGNVSTEDLQEEAGDLRQIVEDPKVRWPERVNAGARLKELEQEITRRRFDGRAPQRQAAHQAGTAREGEYAETVPSFTSPARKATNARADDRPRLVLSDCGTAYLLIGCRLDDLAS